MPTSTQLPTRNNIMKRLLALIALVTLYQISFAQNGTTVVNNLQINSGKGNAPATTLPTGSGVAYVDMNGNVKKSTVLAVIGRNISQLVKLTDTTISVIAHDTSYTLLIRGLYDLATKAYVDSLHSGLLKDTTAVQNVGSSVTTLLYTSPTNDTIKAKALKDGTDIGHVTNSDSTVSSVLKSTGVTPGTYGDATHVPQINIDGNGRVHIATGVVITGGAAGAQIKKSLNSQAGTTYTVVNSDTSTYITTTNGSAVTVSIPDDATSSMSTTLSLDIYQFGAGKVTVAPLNSNITLLSPHGRFKTANQYSKIDLNKISTNVWIVSGDLDTTTVPFLSTSVSSISGLTTVTGTASSSASFIVSGTNLTVNATVTAPTNYEVSLDNSTFSGSVSVTESGGFIAGTTVYVRIASSAGVGTPSGNVAVTSTGASTVNVVVSGTVTSVAASLTVTGTFTSFSSTSGTASTAQTFTISGANLIASVTITPPAGYEVSSNGSTYTSSVTLSQSGGSIPSQPVTIYVRLAASTSAGSYSGNVACTTSGATTRNVAATGTVSAGTPTVGSTTTTLSGFSTATGTPSTSQSFTVTGSNLTANAIVTAPASFEISLNNSTFTSSVSITPSGGTITSTTVYIRITSSASVGSPSGNTTIASTGATTQNIATSGTVTTSSAIDSVVAQVFVAASTVTAVTGWTQIVGNPNTGVVTVTDFTNYQPVIIRSVAGQWPGIGSGGTTSAFNGIGNGSATTFPGGVCSNLWLTAPNGPGGTVPFVGYTANDSALAITGLDPTKHYTITVMSSRTDAIGCGSSPVTDYIVDSTNRRVDSQTVDAHNNNTLLIFKNKWPNAAGIIYLYPGPQYLGVAGTCNQYGILNALRVTKQVTEESLNWIIMIGLAIGLLFKGRRRYALLPILLLISTVGFSQIDSVVNSKIAAQTAALQTTLSAQIATINKQIATLNSQLGTTNSNISTLSTKVSGMPAPTSTAAINALITSAITAFSGTLDSITTTTTTTTDSLLHVLDTLQAIPSGKVGFYDVVLLQSIPATGDAGSCEKLFLVKNVGGKYTLVNQGPVTTCYGTGALGNCVFSLSVASGMPVITITGVSNTTINWTAYYVYRSI